MHIFHDPATSTLVVASLRPHATRAGFFTLIAPNGQVYTVPGGTASTKDAGFDGGDETCAVTGNLATFRPDDGATYHTFAIVVVGTL